MYIIGYFILRNSVKNVKNEKERDTSKESRV